MGLTLRTDSERSIKVATLEKPGADHFPTISKAEVEALVPSQGVALHHMPEEGLPAHRNHGLRDSVGQRSHPGSTTTTKDEDSFFHYWHHSLLAPACVLVIS